MNKIIITTTSFGEYDEDPLNTLGKAGFETILNPYKRKLEKDEIVELCKDAVGIIAGTETLDAPTIRKLTCLKVISRCGTGLDNVDLEAAKKLDIKVFNTPNTLTLAVAELTVGLILDLLKKTPLMDREIRKGLWKKRMGNLLCEKRVGIIGFGRIGKKVAELLKPFGCMLAYTDPFVEDEFLGLKRLHLEDLLKWADVVSIHASTTCKLLGEDEMRLIKRGGWLVNVSRGGVVDEEVLYRILKEDHLAGAALDVFEQEPYKGSLAQLDNVVLTPHIGSYAKEARVKMEREAVENLIKGLRGKD
ncbi:MAG TPA: phosphoglycerate dehydrogenase [Candidatus Wujingus californicus]|uniref:phosphoglycerate dehydrogenase n=1 Tax=Candidatus Wujingus californicus TaxID=3367618 RepID=UPI001DB15282|nr:phosphoglycerate dehydrogenase [Planctomycetota bacterium]MDO8132479.1 phosphoglycerate dehydrogenase [Candidatus Brocadiales bacterium]